MRKDTRSILLGMLTTIAVLFTTYICFFRLGSSFFENYDEAWYGEVTKNMMSTGNYIVPYHNGAVLLDKPPFNFWLNALSSAIFGLSEFAIRIPSAVSGFIVIALIVLFTYRRYGLVPSVFAFSAIALNDIFIWRTRTGNLDALTTLLTVLSFFLIIGKAQKRLLFLGIVFGLLLLEKASFVFYPLSIFVIHEFIYEGRKWRTELKNYAIMAALIVVPSALWLALGTQQVGSKFYQYFLFSSDQGVASLALKHINFDYIMSLYFSLQRYLAIPFLIGLFFVVVGLKKRYHFVLFLFSFLLVALLSTTKKYNNWYLMPSVPFWSIIVALGVQKVQHYGLRFVNKYILNLLLLLPLFYISAKTYVGHIVPIIQTQPNVAEVGSAKMLKSLSKPTDVIMRLDWSYPVTIYYSNRVTKFYPEINENAYRIIKENKVGWVVGKKDQVELFLKDTHGMDFVSIPAGEETILRRIK